MSRTPSSAPTPAGDPGRAGKPPVPPAPPAAVPGGIPPIDQLKNRPIGRVLTKMNKITRDQLVEALTFQKSKGGALGRILVDLGYVKDTDLNIALAAQRGHEAVDLNGDRKSVV